MTTPIIQINNLQKRFGEYQALQGLSLAVHQGCLLYTSPSPRDRG